MTNEQTYKIENGLLVPSTLNWARTLDLTNTSVAVLPEGLCVANNLILDGTEVSELPADLKVGGKVLGWHRDVLSFVTPTMAETAANLARVQAAASFAECDNVVSVGYNGGVYTLRACIPGAHGFDVDKIRELQDVFTKALAPGFWVIDPDKLSEGDWVMSNGDHGILKHGEGGDVYPDGLGGWQLDTEDWLGYNVPLDASLSSGKIEGFRVASTAE